MGPKLQFRPNANNFPYHSITLKVKILLITMQTRPMDFNNYELLAHVAYISYKPSGAQACERHSNDFVTCSAIRTWSAVTRTQR